MNGQKLGQQHPKLNKNSFVYDNEFLNYDDEESEEELSSCTIIFLIRIANQERG